MTTIRRQAAQAAADRIITRDEAQALVAKATADGQVTSYERAQLRAALNSYKDLFTADARKVLDDVLTVRPPPPGQPVPLDPTPSQRPVFLAADGTFTVNANGEPARTPLEFGEALFRAGELIDNARENVFAQLPEATRARVFERLQASLSTTPPAGLDERQALQSRASAGTVLLHLLEATKEPRLQAAMLSSYEALVRAEPDKRLQQSLVFHLFNSSTAQAGDAKRVASSLLDKHAPLKPPYEKWFAGGNTTVKMDWQVGDEFLEGFRRMLTNKGWKETAPGSGVYTKAFNEPGIGETRFEIRTRLGSGSNLLEKLGDPGVHVMGYDGHASWGKNQVRSIKNAPQVPGGGDGQLYFSNLCVGKSQIDAFHEKFPNLQVATTFGSSAVDTDVDGLARLFARRAAWTDINPFLDRVDGEWGRNNFITPASTLVREQVLDRDNDGQADYLDKHFNVSTFQVATDTTREFRPVKQDRPAEVLDGTKIFIAAQVLNTVSEFSGILKQVNEHSRVLPNGWFEPKAGETEVVRFEKVRGADGQPEYRMQVNARYAHMSEEALRATCVYEFNRFLQASGEQRLDPVDRKIASVISFAQSLSIDDSWRDDEVFTNFLSRYNLPAFSRRDIQALLDAEHHDYAGNQAMVAALKAKLPADVLAALQKPEVGEPVRYL